MHKRGVHSFFVTLYLGHSHNVFRSKVGQKGPLFEEFFEYAVAYRTSWLERGFDTPLLNKIVFEKIKRSFGGRLEVCMHFLY